MIRRLLIAAVAALAVFSISLAMAASLGGLTLAGLGADDGAVASCDTDGVSLSYTISYDATDLRLEVPGVTVSGIANACDGKTLTVKFTNSAGTEIGSASSTITNDPLSTVQSLNLSTVPGAELVSNAHVAIS